MGSPRDFDFWLGEWRVEWDDGASHGHNTITKDLGGHVVRERFDGRPGVELRGESVSVYREDVDLWFQTWVDDSGGYYDLRGRFADGEMRLHCDYPQTDGEVTLRMRFLDIEDDRFTWKWERSNGDGDWRLLWQLAYTRRPSNA